MFGHVYGAIHGVGCLPMEIIEQIDDYQLISRTATDLSRLANA